MNSLVRVRQGIVYWTSIGQSLLRSGDARGYHVLCYPKSGSNWMCSMLSRYFDLPVLEPWREPLPVFSQRIYHLHRILPCRSVDRRTIYMLRDGRDVFVSYLFAMLRSPNGSYLRKRVFELVGQELTEETAPRFLGEFIQHLHGSRSASVNYHEHVTHCLERGFCVVRFEKLVADPVAEFTRAVQFLTDSEADSERVERAVREHSFSNKRSAKNEHFMRSGKSGDWRSYFTRRSATTFWTYYGEAMIRAGYEVDGNWIQQLPE